MQESQTTYWHQMKGFLHAIQQESLDERSKTFNDFQLTASDDSIATMRTLDNIYIAAGMPLRP